MHLTESTLFLVYTEQLVNAAQGSSAFYNENHKKHMYTDGKMERFYN